MKRKITSMCIIMLVLLSTLVLFTTIENASGDQPQWPSSWTLMDTDPVENAQKAYRDVKCAYYIFNSNYIYFKLECYGYPNFSANPDDSRYKWFIDVDDPYNMIWVGGNVVEADYMLFIEDTNNDGVGDIYLLNDVDGDGSFNEWEPPNNWYDTLITDVNIANYSIFGKNICLWLKLENISDPEFAYFTWSTDQENSNINQAPTLDRSDTFSADLSKADLSIIKSDSVDPVNYGGSFSYILDVENHGPHVALNVNVTDVLPDEVTFVSSYPAPTGSIGSTYWWNYDSFSVQQHKIITINVSVNAGFLGTINNTATVYNDTRDPLPGNNEYTEQTIVSDIISPSKVQNLVVVDTLDGNLSLTWNPASDNIGIDHYEIFRNGTFLVNTSGTSYLDSELNLGQTYSYTVRAVDAAGNKGEFSDPAVGTPTIPDTESPSKVENLSAIDAKDGKIDLSWDPATDNVGVDHYEIFRDGAFLVNVSGTFYQDSGLNLDQHYNYTVRAVDAAGNLGEFSDPATGVSTASPDIEPPSKVENLSALDAKDGKINLSWDPATDNVGVDHYEIFRDEIFLINVTGTTYQDTGLNISQYYNYTVRAVDAAGNIGEFSDPARQRSTKTSPPSGSGNPSHGNPVENNPIPNILPIADLSAGEPYTGFVNEDIRFDGSLSYDSDGNIVEWLWDFGDGTTKSGETVTHNYSLTGEFKVILKVTDDDDAYSSDETVASIIQPNRPPSIPVINGTTKGLTNIEYNFSVASTDDDNDSIKYIISWGDGSFNQSDYLPSGEAFVASHKWTKKGNYTITVLSDDNSTISTEELTITIKEPPAIPEENNFLLILLALLALLILFILLLLAKRKKDNDEEKEQEKK